MATFIEHEGTLFRIRKEGEVARFRTGFCDWANSAVSITYLLQFGPPVNEVFEVFERVVTERNAYMKQVKVFTDWDKCNDWVAGQKFNGFLIENDTHSYIEIKDGIIG